MLILKSDLLVSDLAGVGKKTGTAVSSGLSLGGPSKKRKPKYAQTLKFNPYHDHLGKFAEAPGGRKSALHTSDIDEAVRALHAGRKVVLSQPRELSTLLDKLADIARDAEAKGDKAPNYNLCQVSVSGTNIFCHKNKGIPRIKMPQLSGQPLPGSKADGLKKNARGEVDLSEEFIKHLEAKGVKITLGELERADFMRATQNELNGTKVGGIARAIRAGKIEQTPLFVSEENYVLDGHHRWAATVGVDFEDNVPGNIKIPVRRINMPILDLVAESNKFASDWGIPQADVGKAVPKVQKLEFRPFFLTA